jgi:hypothetical protein
MAQQRQRPLHLRPAAPAAIAKTSVARLSVNRPLCLLRISTLHLTSSCCFDRQGNTSTVENETYLYWIKLPVSAPSQASSSPTTRLPRTQCGPTSRRSGTQVLEDLSIEVTDHTFENGVCGKMVVYRWRNASASSSSITATTKGDSISIIKRSDIDDKLRERNIEVRPILPRRRIDSRVEGVPAS